MRQINSSSIVTSVKWLLVTLILISLIPVSANEELLRLTPDARYWSLPSGNYSNWRYSNLDQINNKNAGKLRLEWSFSTGSLKNHAGGPLVLPSSTTGLTEDTLFIHTPYPNEVLAINLATKELEWAYKTEINPGGDCCQSTNYGISYANGRIFIQRDDLRLVALDVRSGRMLWQQSTGYGLQGYANINPPQPVGNLVLTNIYDVNGVSVSVGAYRISDGGLVWKAGSVGSDADILFDQNTSHLGSKVGQNSSANSWVEHFPEANYRAWVSLAWDRRENMLYYGTPSDKKNDSERPPGEKRWTSSIIARDLTSGKARWVYQLTPENEWGFNGSSEMLLADLKIGENQVPVLVHFDQNGFSYVLNRITGELISADKLDPSVNWATHINISTGRPVRNINASRYLTENKYPMTICPAPDGVKSENPASFSPRTGYFYVPTSHACIVYEQQEQKPVLDLETGFDLHPQSQLSSRIIPAGFTDNNGTEYMGNLIAWDAGRRQQLWAVREKWPVKSGILSTAGDIVFYGTLDGYVKLVDAKTGLLLKQFKVPSGVAGNFSSWMYKGKQYIGVLTGVDPDKLPELGLGNSADYAGLASDIRAGGTLLVFSLP